MTIEERLDHLEVLVDALTRHEHTPDGKVAIRIQCLEEALYDHRRQRAIDKKATAKQA